MLFTCLYKESGDNCFSVIPAAQLTVALYQ
nr:MAG TPA: hypothetical protein [Caudoviricetes sp.]